MSASRRVLAAAMLGGALAATLTVPLAGTNATLSDSEQVTITVTADLDDPEQATPAPVGATSPAASAGRTGRQGGAAGPVATPGVPGRDPGAAPSPAPPPATPAGRPAAARPWPFVTSRPTPAPAPPAPPGDPADGPDGTPASPGQSSGDEQSVTGP